VEERKLPALTENRTPEPDASRQQFEPISGVFRTGLLVWEVNGKHTVSDMQIRRETINVSMILVGKSIG
jgi:hypothetical protein